MVWVHQGLEHINVEEDKLFDIFWYQKPVNKPSRIFKTLANHVKVAVFCPRNICSETKSQMVRVWI